MTDPPAKNPEDHGRPRPAPGLYSACVWTAVVAGVFVGVVSVLLLVDATRRRAKDPLDTEAFKQAKVELAELAAQPRTEQVEARMEKLKESIRAMDVELRGEYFFHREFSRVGAWMLVGGVAVLLLASRAAAALRPRLPDPGQFPPAQDLETRWTQGARAGVGVLALLLVATAVVLSLGIDAALPGSEAELAALLGGEGGEAPAAGSDFPSSEELARNWPCFRGPGASGISAYTDMPTSWDEASGKNILWKTPVPLPGNNSPVVWKDRVFLSGADEKTRQVYCFDTADGRLLWRADVPGTPQSTLRPPEVTRDTGFAAPTGVTDGRRFYAMFANGDVAAFDFGGKLIWQQSLGIPENSYGHAASLAMYRNLEPIQKGVRPLKSRGSDPFSDRQLVIIQFDQAGRKDGKSRLIALEGATGKTAWKVPRPVPNSWASPIVVLGNGGSDRDQIVTAADPFVIAYNPADGAELWRAKCLQADVGPTPVFRDGVVYTANEFPQLTAIKADGNGDVTDTHILWTGEDGLPDACSPLASEKHVFLLASYGILTCYDRQSGRWLWELELDGHFYSSPSLVGERVYLFGEVEKPEEEMTAEDRESDEPVMICRAWVIEPGAEEGKIVGEGRLEEGCVTSPAFQPGRFYIRGRKHLYAIGQP